MSDKKQLTPQIGSNLYNFKSSFFNKNSPYAENMVKNNNFFQLNELMNIANKHIKQEMFENDNFKQVIASMSQVYDYMKIFNDCNLGYEIVLAGGAVRDTILKTEVKDADFFIRLVPMENGILDIKKIVLNKYQEIYPNNPFIEFLKTINNEYYFNEKRKDGLINIFELDIDEYLKMQSVEVKNSILEKVMPYMSNLKDEKIIVKNGSFILQLNKDTSEEVVEVETTLTVFSLMMTLVKDVSTIDSNMFLQLTNLKRDFIRDVSYLRFSTRKVGAIFKIDNNLMPIDLIFETGNSYPMESFDWSLNKVGIVMESIQYKELSSIWIKKFLDENKNLKIKELNKNNLKSFFELDNFSEYFNYDISLIEKKGEENNQYYSTPPNKYFIRLDLLPINSCKDVIERVVFNQCFIDSLEYGVINYEINFNSFKKLEYEMIVRKNKLLMKYPYFNYKYEWHSLLREAAELLEHGDYEKDKDFKIEPAFYEAVQELINFKETMLMKDDLSLRKENGVWVFDKQEIRKIKPKKF